MCKFVQVRWVPQYQMVTLSPILVKNSPWNPMKNEITPKNWKKSKILTKSQEKIFSGGAGGKIFFSKFCQNHLFWKMNKKHFFKKKIFSKKIFFPKFFPKLSQFSRNLCNFPKFLDFFDFFRFFCKNIVFLVEFWPVLG